MTQSEKVRTRERLTELAMDLIERNGAMIAKSDLVAESRMSRARIDELFPEENDLFDAIVAQWFSHDIAIMEEIVRCELPIRRKFFEFFCRRFLRERERHDKDPALFALYCELGSERFEQVRGYIDLADHYLSELIAQAQDEGYFSDLPIDRALSLINQMVIAYTSPQIMLMIAPRLHEDKLAAIVDTLFAGLSARDGGALGTQDIRVA
ncbi:TetR/AcrR family transcriptional regulator [Qipengyuania qiaonensis]|uniref:Tetracyclin repressor-like C-terminal domain-containing protein n=1 Tax=Qipengyuania qiaonensis TaxID=2867240 RepID=A0ABS7J3G4_9SPHN|nr:TetR/AcrR family transcriptional regulator [Qipengyuania qiaonensis]MBX7481867.1 hypothetical protein [Qipengyuania qiaonensis]